MNADPIQWTLASVVAAAGAGAAATGGGPAPEDVSPGVIGFLVTLALVLACIPLFRSMTGKLRGVQHRGRATYDDGASGGRPTGSPGSDADPNADGGRDAGAGPRSDAGAGPRLEG